MKHQMIRGRRGGGGGVYTPKGGGCENNQRGEYVTKCLQGTGEINLNRYRLNFPFREIFI